MFLNNHVLMYPKCDISFLSYCFILSNRQSILQKNINNITKFFKVSKLFIEFREVEHDNQMNYNNTYKTYQAKISATSCAANAVIPCVICTVFTEEFFLRSNILISPDDDPVNNCGVDFRKDVPNTHAVCSLQIITFDSNGGNLLSNKRTEPSPQPTVIIAPVHIFKKKKEKKKIFIPIIPYFSRFYKVTHFFVSTLHKL